LLNLKQLLRVIEFMGVAFALLGLVILSYKNDALTAKLAVQSQMTEQYHALSKHRLKQLDELHALINEHNERVAIDWALLDHQQTRIGELEDYLEQIISDEDNVCLYSIDVERLWQIWPSPAGPATR